VNLVSSGALVRLDEGELQARVSSTRRYRAVAASSSPKVVVSRGRNLTASAGPSGIGRSRDVASGLVQRGDSRLL
jgi:hypothetical protein